VRHFVTSFAVLLCFATGVYAADQKLRISLGEAIRLAAEKNLNVRAELYNPAQFEADINRNRAIYDPQVSIQTFYSDSTVPVPDSNGSSSLSSSLSSVGHSFQFNSSISQLFWSGATASLFFNNGYTETNLSATFQKYYRSSLGVTVSQPLLKNFGRENTEINISISRLSKFSSLEHFYSLLLNTISQVRTEYFKLYSLREQLEVRKVSLDLSRRILSETKARVAAGVLPAMEILNAEFGVTSREKDLIDTEKAVSDQVDVLQVLLQSGSRTDIIISDLPRREPYQVNQDEAIKRALTRPDIKEQKRNLDISELQTRVFNNNIKPDLSLNLSSSLVGLDRGYFKNLENMGSLDNPAWSVGFAFNYPLGNNAAINNYRRSRLKSAQTVLQIRILEENATNEVLSAIRAISSGYKLIEVADRGRAFAEERLRAFIRKNEVGLATTKDVLDVENDLANAKNNQITAVVTYDNAITHLQQVTGELLEREGIRVVEGDADKLYSNTR